MDLSEKLKELAAVILAWFVIAAVIGGSFGICGGVGIAVYRLIGGN